jgi:alkylhydroperoxidase family enzyme
VPKEKFDALPDYATSPVFSELERLVIRYAQEMTRNVQVDRALVESLKRHLSPEALVQLTLGIAAANFTNRFNEALGTELET